MKPRKFPFARIKRIFSRGWPIAFRGAAACSATAFALAAQAAEPSTGWDGGAGSPYNWSGNNNWNPDGQPPYGIITFSGAVGTTNVVDQNYNMHQLFWTGSTAWVLNNANNAAVTTFDFGGAQSKVENQSSGVLIINAPITFAANNASPPNPFGEVNAVNGDMIFGSGATLTVNGSSVNGIKLFGGSHVLTFSNTVIASGKWFGHTTGGTGNTVNIWGSFTSSDFYVMNDGTLNLNSGGSLTTSVRLGGDFGNTGNQNLAKSGTFNLASAGGGQTFSGVINSVSGNTSGTLSANSQNTSGTNAFSGHIALDAALKITQAAGGTLNISQTKGGDNSTGNDIKGNTETFTPAAGGTINMSGTIYNSTGSGSVVMNGAGTLTLSGANTYGGSTTASSGIVDVQNSSGLGAGSATVASGAALQMDGSGLNVANALTLNGAGISSGGALRNLANNNTWSGTVTLGSASRINSDARTLTLNSATTIGGATFGLTVGGSGNVNISSVIGTGTGTVTKDGAGTLTLSGANTFGGALTVQSGTLAIATINNVSANGTLGNSATAVTLGSSGNTATLDYTGNTTTSSTKPFALAAGGTGIVQVDTSGQTLTLSGVISGSGNLVKNGAGTLLLSGANTYSGTTAVQSGGAIKISNASALGGSGAGQGTTVNTGGQLQTTLALTIAEPLTLNGTGLATDGALLVTANGPTFTGPITLGSIGVRVQNSGAAATISGGITGSGFDLTLVGSAQWTVDTSPINIGSATLTKDGANILVLKTANTIGAVNQNLGSINIGNAGCLGQGTLTIGSSVGSGGTDAGLLAGSGLGTLNVPNNIVLSSGSVCGLAPAASGTILDLGGVINGAGSMRRTRISGTGAGIVRLSGANTFSGGFVHATDSLVLNHKQALGTGTYTIGDTTFPSAAAINISANTALTGANAVPNPVTINTNAFTWSGSADLEFSGNVTLLTSPTITVSSSGAAIFSGIISGGGLGITKAGSGTLTLGGTDTYSGATTVTGSGSKLLVNGSINNSAVTVQTGAILGGSGSIGALTVSAGGTLAPGNSIATMTVNSSPGLSGIAAMEISETSGVTASDKLVVNGSALTYGGTLTVTLLGTSDPLAGGETFDLFDATSFSGAFSATNLPPLGAGLNWWTDKLYVDGSITVNRAPTAVDKTYSRAKNTSLKIQKSDLLAGASDADSGDSVSYDALVSTGSQGATVTEDANQIFYAPANNNSDTLQYRLKDTRGGTVTKNIAISVTNAVGVITITNSAGGSMTVSFYGIPGTDYVIQRSPDLSAWTDVITNTAPSDGLIQYTEIPPYSPAFYRTRQP